MKIKASSRLFAMNNIKLIISDMDGTLLNEKHELSQYTIDILKNVQDKGIGIVLASGRSLKDLDLFGKQLDLYKHPLSGYITLNGLETYNSNKLNITRHSCLGYKDVLKMNKISLDYHVPLLLCFENGNYLLNGDSIDQDFIVDISDFIVTNINEIKLLRKSLLKIVLCASADIIDKMLNTLDKTMYEEYEISRVEKEWVEINPKGIHKGAGVLDYLNYHHVTLDQVIIFGNGENDIDMLKLSSNSVAVENALDRVKRYAAYICQCNIKDGVAHFIEEKVL